MRRDKIKTREKYQLFYVLPDFRGITPYYVIQIEINFLKSGYLRVVSKLGKWQLAKEVRAIWIMSG